MSAYVIARINVTDWDTYKIYTKHTPRTIAKYGGRFIARAAEAETFEGAQDTLRIVVLEFPSKENARNWYHGPEYQEAKKLREGAGEGHFILVGGFPEEDWLQAVAASEALG